MYTTRYRPVVGYMFQGKRISVNFKLEMRIFGLHVRQFKRGARKISENVMILPDFTTTNSKLFFPYSFARYCSNELKISEII